MGPLLAASNRAETLLVVVESGPNSLDIHGVGTSHQSYGTSWNIYDRLLTYGTKTLPDGSLSYDYTQLKPELAESWQVAPDGMSVTFTLRPDATFHDGTPVTAEDVKWSFDRAVTVGGFPTFQMKAGSLEKPEQFIAVDARTFRIDFLRKDKMTLPDIAVPVPVVINAKLAKQNATATDPWAMEWLKANAAGSGAFKVASWKPGQEIVFVRNDAWKSGPLPRLKRVIVREVPSASARQALLEKGDADVSYQLSPKDATDLARTGKFTVIGHPVENANWYLGLTATMPPFDQPKVRQAIACAVPYEAIFANVFFGRGNRLFGAESLSDAPVWPQPFTWKTDPAKAKALLAEAGFPKGFSTTLAFDQGTSSVAEPVALLVQEALAAIDVTVTIDKIPGANWRAALLKKNLPMHINRFGGWLNYPEYYFFWGYHGQNALFNTMSYTNPAMDALIDAARFEADPAKYGQLVTSFVRIANDEVPRIPLIQHSLDVAMQKGVTGYRYWFHLGLDFRDLVKQ